MMFHCLGLDFFTQNDCVQFQSFTYKIHNSVFLKSSIIFHCVNISYFHYKLMGI